MNPRKLDTKKGSQVKLNLSIGSMIKSNQRPDSSFDFSECLQYQKLQQELMLLRQKNDQKENALKKLT